MTKTYTIKQNNQTLFEITVKAPDDNEVYSNIKWDSETGLVTATKSDGKKVVLEYEGNGVGKIPPGPITTTNISSVDYRYSYI